MINYKTDCYFYNEDRDMGAIISTCSYDPNNWIWGECKCFNCQNYLSKKEANKIIRNYFNKEVNNNE
jgi:hypothetical protein